MINEADIGKSLSKLLESEEVISVNMTVPEKVTGLKSTHIDLILDNLQYLTPSNES